MDNVTYDVRFWKTKVYKGKKVTTHTVRWVVGGKEWQEHFRSAAQADSFRASLVSAARKGEAFRLDTGRPVSWAREESSMTWYTFTLSYVEAKWPYASPNHRRGIAEALVDATEVLLTTEKGAPSQDMRRAALRWAYAERIRDGGEPPEDLAKALRWLENNTIRLSAFKDRARGAALARSILDRISRTKQGKPAAANTANRKRTILNNAMEFAVELDVLPSNPLKAVKWTKPRTPTTVDPRVVINIEQARRFLAAVRRHGSRGERMEAFFACMYYAALRPAEAVALRQQDCHLPASGWGRILVDVSRPEVTTQWTDTGDAHEERGLKHRGRDDVRPVPRRRRAPAASCRIRRGGTDPQLTVV